MRRIAIDLMGSDLGPGELIKAIESFKDKHNDVSFIVVGKKEEIDPLKGKCELVYAEEVLDMSDGALEILRKKEASMNKAIALVKDGKADGVLSAGSTGAFISSCTIQLKLINNIERAALVSPFPKKDGNKVIVLDIGANNENSSDHIVNFAKIGAIYASKYLNKADLNIYLLSNGVEEKKGSPVIKEAHQKIKSLNLKTFKGNIEARNILNGDADLVICGGYEGNVFLKATEGAIMLSFSLIKKAFKRNLLAKLGYLLSKKGFKEMQNHLDYNNYGGAVLLGVNGIAVKAHGSSNAYAFENAIKLVYDMIGHQIINSIREDLKNE